MNVPNHRHTTTLSRLLVGTALLALLAGLPACRRDTSNRPPRQILPDMDDQPKAKSQSVSHFFHEFESEGEAGKEGEAFGRAMREPVEGTVPWGWKSHTGTIQNVDFAQRDLFLKDDPRVFTGRQSWDPTSAYVERIPVPVTRELIEQGRQKYEVLCIVCHGGTGHGDGMVGRRWSYVLPSFHDAAYKPGGDKGQDGLIFWTIRHGVAGANPGDPPKMPTYASKVNEMEAWAIVAYVRALQLSQGGAYDARDEAALRNAPVVVTEEATQ